MSYVCNINHCYRNYVAAESALDRMCCGLGGKIMLALIVGRVPEMLNSEDWRRRHAALMAVSSAGEGCHKQMEQMLDQVVSAVLNYLTDPVSYHRSQTSVCPVCINISFVTTDLSV